MTTAEHFSPPQEPGKWASVGLAVFVHLVLVVLLFFTVRWQNRAPEAVEVDLYRAGPSAAAPRQAAPPEPKPVPKVEPRPEPAPEPKPKAEPKPEPEPKPVPKAEPKPAPPPPKPDIALKDKTRPPPKEAPKEAPAPVPKPDPDMRRKLLAEQLRRETEQLSQHRVQQQAAQEAAALQDRQAAAALTRARTDWTDKIKQKIRGNIVVPPGVTGNPEAVFAVSLLPDGAVLSLKLMKSTGNSALDAAIERAINKSSPLPKPDDNSIFERELSLRFRPLEE